MPNYITHHTPLALALSEYTEIPRVNNPGKMRSTKNWRETLVELRQVCSQKALSNIRTYGDFKVNLDGKITENGMRSSVALVFETGGKTIAFYCDSYMKASHNLRSITEKIRLITDLGDNKTITLKKTQ